MGLFLHKKQVPSLPDELYLEIFLRLPVKSILTCKCVSKTWFSIISNPDFVKLHLNHTLNNMNNNSRIMISGYDRKIKATLIYSVAKHTLFSMSKFYGKAVVMEHHPFKYARLLGMLGSCNGLVCLRHYHQGCHFFSLWNPATNEYIKIPPSRFQNSLSDFVFCYDYKNDDYKLVYGVWDDVRTNFSVYVYTLRSNSWKTIQALPYTLHTLHGVFVNGAFHWIAETPKVIVSFNITDENFKEVQLPTEIMEMHHVSTIILKVLEGCLCVIYMPRNEAWVMREYGVWESWTKHQNMVPMEHGQLKWSSVNGECLIYSAGTHLVLSVPKHSSARRLKLGSLEIEDVNTYIESLVSLNFGTYQGKTRRRGICLEIIGILCMLLLVFVGYIMLWPIRCAKFFVYSEE